MQRKSALILSLSLTMAACGQTGKPFTCTGTVVDFKSRSVGGAEVICYEGVYAYERGQRLWEILGRTKTNQQGRFSLEIRPKDRDRVWVAARAPGLALGWQGANRESAVLDFIVELGKPAILAGIVVDDNNKGIIGAKVRLCLRNEFAGGRSSVTFNIPEDWFTTRTDGQGKFSFATIPAHATADFWAEAPGKVGRWTFQKTDFSEGTQFEAGRNDVRIVLDPEARIMGQVIDEDTGGPVESIQVLARPDTRWAHYYCSDPVISDSQGKFCFTGMSAETYALQIVPSRGKMADWAGKDVKITVAPGQIIRDVKVPVGKGAILELAVRDADTDQPAEGVTVIVSQKGNFGRHNCYYKSVVTDDTGNLSFRVPEGECRLWAGSHEYAYDHNIEPVTAVMGKVTKREILLDRNPHVSGVVCDQNGRPVKGIAVTSKPTCNRTDFTDANGRFEVSWFSRSPLRKKFMIAQDTERNRAGLAEIKDETRPVDIQLESAFTLKGQIADSDGEGIPRAAVNLRASLPGWNTNVGDRVFTNEKGFYQIDAIPPPQDDFKYFIEVNAANYGPLSLREISFGDGPAKPVEVETVILPLADQSISGAVVDSEDAPAAGIRIFLSGPRGSDTAGQPSRRTVTDDQGRFFIKRVCQGPLRIQAGYSSDPKGAGFLDAQGGDKNVKVILGQHTVHVPYVSLVGKSLPDLNVFGDNLSTADAKGKMLLICFFDIQQRPSRYSIRQLVNQADYLKKEGVAVVVVQASTMDKTTLDEWVKKYHVPFWVGRNDDEKTRFAWGIKSLPWLILADRGHTVRAEGFGLDELDARIKGVKQ